MTSKEYKELVSGKKPSKYKNNKPSYYDPVIKRTLTFDSNKELRYYLVLRDREKKGEIDCIERQYKIEIQPAFTDSSGKKHRSINYLADFYYIELKRDDNGEIIDFIAHVVDVKGYKTEVYKLKKKLLAYKGIIIEEV